MELLIKYLKNWWTESVLPTVQTMLQKHRENTDDVIDAVQRGYIDEAQIANPIVGELEKTTQAIKDIPQTDLSNLIESVHTLDKTMKEKDLTVNIGETKVEVKPVIEGLKDVAKNLKTIEKKIPKLEKQKFIDYTKKFDALIKKTDSETPQKLDEINESIKGLDLHTDLVALSEWLKVIAEKEYPELDLPRDKDGIPLFTPTKVGGGGGGLTAIETGYLKTIADNAGGGGSSTSKPTDAYGYQTKSTTATHKHFFFEDKDGNWYIKRKTLATEVFDYTKGTGGYDSVFVDKDSAPSGTLTWGSFGDTF